MQRATDIVGTNIFPYREVQDRPMMHRQPAPRPALAAFTLVEMALVLSIIGLVIGGILAGTSLLNNSKNTAVITDLHKFKAAVVQFRQQYGGYPGDITDATDYWGADPAGCPAGSSTLKKETCNGNGNGQIEINTQELSRAWQQLSDAGLVTGAYSGYNSSPRGMVVGMNAPAGPHEGSAYTLCYVGTVLNGWTTWWEFAGDFGTVIYYGLQESGDLSAGPIMTTQEAASIDRKVDDGMPATGVIFTDRAGYSSSCVTDTNMANITTSQYNTSVSGKLCDLGYKIDQ